MLFAATSCNPVGPKSVTIVGPSFVIEKQTVLLEARADRAKYDNDFVWTVDNTNVATINANTGLFTAKAKGTVKVTATCKYNKRIKNDTKISVFKWVSEDKTTFLTTYKTSYSALVEKIESEETAGRKMTITNAEDGCSFMGSPANKGSTFMLKKDESSPSEGIRIHSVAQDDVIMDEPSILEKIMSEYQTIQGYINSDEGQLYFCSINPEAASGSITRSFLMFKADGTILSYYVEDETYLVFEH